MTEAKSSPEAVLERIQRVCSNGGKYASESAIALSTGLEKEEVQKAFSWHYPAAIDKIVDVLCEKRQVRREWLEKGEEPMRAKTTVSTQEEVAYG